MSSKSSKSGKTFLAKKMSGMVSKNNAEIIMSCLAELVGTAILVLFGSGPCLLKGDTGEPLALIALTFGLTATCLVAVFGPISGCHINPAVTVGLLANGQINPIKAVAYVLSQCGGAIGGAWVLTLVMPKITAIKFCTTRLTGVLPALHSASPTALQVITMTPILGIIIESLITFVLVYVYCKLSKSNSDLGPLTIGLAVTIGHLFGFQLTRASMNPARSLGAELFNDSWQYHYVYWVGPLIGGVVAGLSHRYIF